MSIKAHILNFKRVVGMLDPLKVARGQLDESKLDYMKSEDTRTWQECVSEYHRNRIDRLTAFIEQEERDRGSLATNGPANLSAEEFEHRMARLRPGQHIEMVSP